MTGTTELTLRALALFEEICDLDPAEREVVLARECAGRPKLRAEVEALVAGDDNADGFLGPESGAARALQLDALVASVASVERGDAPSPEPPRELPERIGRYLIVSVLGEGGMGLVYEAEQSSPRRRVALKVARPGALSVDRRLRIEREIEVLGRLKHPGIAQIFEAGEESLAGGEPRPFFAMEFVEGVDLVAFAAREKLDVSAKLDLFCHVGDAIQHAHEQGVLHRDLKPDNVLVQPDGMPKVLDFGIAQLADAEMQLTAASSSAMRVLGTLAYMSPEQARGANDELDATTDVYALGVLLFELLTGATPHALRGLSLPVALARIQSDDPRRLSALAPELGDDLDAICGKALDPIPKRRYPTARALIDDVRRLRRHEPILARPPSAIYQLKKFARRNRALVAGGASTFVALVIGLVAALIFAFHARDESQRAQRQTYGARIGAANAALAASDPEGARANLLAAPEALRGWEWRHLTSRVDDAAVPFDGAIEPASGPGTLLARTPDGALVLAIDGSGVVLWDAATKHRRARHELGLDLTCIADTTAGGEFAVGTADGRVWIVDLLTGERRAAWTSNGGLSADPAAELADARIDAIDWDRSGTRIVFVTKSTAYFVERGKLRILLRIGAPKRQGLLFVRSHRSVHVAQDGGSAVIENGARKRLTAAARVVRLPDGELLHRLAGDQGSFTSSPRLSLDGASLVAGNSYGQVRVHATDTLADLRTFGGQTGPVAQVRWSPDGRQLLTSTIDQIVLREPLSGRPTAAWSVGGFEGERIDDILFASPGSVVGRIGRRVVGWELDRRGAAVLEGHESYVYSLAFSEDGGTLLSRDYGGVVFAWDTLARRPLARVPGSRSNALALAGERVLITAVKKVRILDLATLAVTREYERDALDEDNPVARRADAVGLREGQLTEDAALSADGRYIALANGRRLLARETGEELAALGSTPLPASGVCFHPTEPLVVFANAELSLFAVPSLELVRTFEGHEGPVYAAEFSPDGTRLASGGRDGTVRIWNPETGELLLTLRGHQSYVRALAWSPDGALLASGSGDKTIRLWDSAPRRQRHAQRIAAETAREAARPAVERAMTRAQTPAEAAAELRAGFAGVAEEERAAGLRLLLDLLHPAE